MTYFLLAVIAVLVFLIVRLVQCVIQHDEAIRNQDLDPRVLEHRIVHLLRHLERQGDDSDVAEAHDALKNGFERAERMVSVAWWRQLPQDKQDYWRSCTDSCLQAWRMFRAQPADR